MKKVKIMQGDVQAFTIESLPVGAKETPNKPIALGEVHGHAHVLTGDVQRYEVNNRVIFLVKTLAILQHVNISIMNDKTYKTTETLPMEDHKPHTLQAGIYEFVIQNEYNPYKKIMEQVRD